ncbi:MAG: alpha/beta hydrolase [Chloroflexi bacterium]|nr:alpha/beta hydrolase [Chloroflexota bacterium]MBI3338536.1 alpha/beta hydrolase [Chloroflexota bacterium]
MPTAAGLYYFAHEAENLARPPVILIHGAGGTHLHWPPQVRRLHHQRIFAVDLPGHGKSEGLGHQIIGDYADHIIEFIKAVKLSSAVLVGHSMGGAIALDAAIRFPKRVAALGLVGSGSKLRVSPAILQSASSPSTFMDAVNIVKDFSYSEHASARLKELGAQKLAETRPTVLYGDFLACDAFNATDQLSKISAPTLIVCGADDKMTPPKYSELLRDTIPNARMEIVPKAGHMVMLEQPETVAELLAGFLNTISYQAGQG